MSRLHLASPIWKKSEYEIANSILCDSLIDRQSYSQEGHISVQGSPNPRILKSPCKTPIRFNHHAISPLDRFKFAKPIRSSRMIRRQEQIVQKFTELESKQRISLPHLMTQINKTLDSTRNSASRASYIINTISEMAHMKSEKLFSKMYSSKIFIKKYEKLEAPNSLRNHKNILGDPIRTVAKCERSEIFKKKHNYYAVIRSSKRLHMLMCK